MTKDKIETLKIDPFDKTIWTFPNKINIYLMDIDNRLVKVEKDIKIILGSIMSVSNRSDILVDQWLRDQKTISQLKNKLAKMKQKG